MSFPSPMRPFGVVGLLLALVLSPARLLAAPATPGPASGFDICGALTADPGLAEAWPTAKGVRPGETVLDTDKGLGCRFTPPGKPGGGAVLLEARLTRPAATGAGAAVDRWRVPARKGEPAAIVYAFYPPGRATPGEWTLAVYDGETRLAAAIFTVTGTAIRDAVAPPAPEEAMPDAPAEADPKALPAAPPAVVPAPTAEAAPTSAPEAPKNTPKPQAAPAATAPKPAKPVVATPKPPQPIATKSVATPKETPAKPAAGKPAAAPATGFYTLQTGLFADAANADTQAAKIRRRGIPACLAVEGSGKTRRYRVLAGRYGDKRAALAMRADVSRAAGVRPLLFAVDPAQANKLRCH